MTGNTVFVPLRELVNPASRSEKVCSTDSYKLLGVSLGGRGAFHRETKFGSEISASTLFRVEEGDLVYSRLFAWQGAFSLIGSDLRNCYVSNEFPVFTLNRERVHPQYLIWWLCLGDTLKTIEADCTGSTPLTRNRYKEHFFLNLTIPIPPIEVQERTVQELQVAFEKILEATRISHELASDFDRLLVAMAHREDLTEEQKLAAGWKRVRLGEVMTLDLDPVKVDPSDKYPNLGIFSFGKGLFHKPPISGLETSAPTLYRVKSGQFIYSRLFAFEGSYCFVSEEFDGKFVSGEYPTFTCDRSLCRAEFVYSYFKPKKVWETLSAKSKGLGLRRQRVQAPAILDHEVWLPPLTEQHRIAEVLRAKRQYDALNTFERDAEALRRSILAKAFRGELV